MEDLKNYWWMAITIPALAYLIYITAKRSMKGIAILGTIFGSGVIIFWFILYPKWGINHLFVGIVWLLLSLGWLIKDRIKERKSV